MNRLSDLGRQILRFKCERCDRAGQYRADRLLALIGDLTHPEVADAIAAKGGCAKALNPPDISDISSYQDKRCQNKWVRARPPPVPVLAAALHEGWRGFVICQRHHQGLKSAKPCKGASELDLSTLVATLGHGTEVDKVKSRVVAPCCGSDSFVVEWLLPDGSRR